MTNQHHIIVAAKKDRLAFTIALTGLPQRCSRKRIKAGKANVISKNLIALLAHHKSHDRLIELRGVDGGLAPHVHEDHRSINARLPPVRGPEVRERLAAGTPG